MKRLAFITLIAFLTICSCQVPYIDNSLADNNELTATVKYENGSFIILSNNSGITDSSILEYCNSFMQLENFEESKEYDITIINSTERIIELPCDHFWVKDSDKSDIHKHWLGWLTWVTCERREIRCHCIYCGKTMIRTEHIY